MAAVQVDLPPHRALLRWLGLPNLRRVHVPVRHLEAILFLFLGVLLSICFGLLVPSSPATRASDSLSAPALSRVATANVAAPAVLTWASADVPLVDLDALSLSSVWDGPRASEAAAQGAGGHAVTMSDIVVGVMTCDRFLPTRGLALRSTWLHRARRVLFFSDSPFSAAGAPGPAPSPADYASRMDRDPMGGAGGAQAAAEAPVLRHAFRPSAHERIFSGGNWRAVPILWAMAETFFSARAQAALQARSEPRPRWAFIADDDSFVVTSELEKTLSRWPRAGAWGWGVGGKGRGGMGLR